MFPFIPYIQDIAGKNSPVAPFAKSDAKNILAVLYQYYNSEGKLRKLKLYDYISSKGMYCVGEKSINRSGDSICQYICDKNGNLLQSIHESTFPQKSSWTIEHKESFPEFIDLYKDGYLCERKFKNKNRIEYYSFSNEQKCICRECRFSENRLEEADVIEKIIEGYDDKGRLKFQNQCKSTSDNPSEIIYDAMHVYFYDDPDNNSITQSMTTIKNDTHSNYVTFYQDEFEDFDDMGNWTKRTRSRISDYHDFEFGGKTILTIRKIAYNENAAQLLLEEYDKLSNSIPHIGMPANIIDFVDRSERLLFKKGRKRV